MQQLYTQKQLVSFGNYLLNTHRVKDAMEQAKAGTDGELDTEFITQVYDADLANWSELAGLKYTTDNPKVDGVEVTAGDPIMIHRGNVESDYTWYLMPSEDRVASVIITPATGNGGFATIQEEAKDPNEAVGNFPEDYNSVED